MFRLLLGVMVFALMAGMYWLTGRLLSFCGVDRKHVGFRLLRAGLSVLFIVLCRRWRMVGLIGVYLMGAYALFDLLAFIIRRSVSVLYRADSRTAGSRMVDNSMAGDRKQPPNQPPDRSKLPEWYRFCRRIYRSGIVPALAAGILLVCGYFNMLHIVPAEYTVTSDKLRSDYTVVLLTDTHYDTIQSPELLEKMAGEINRLHPDLVVLGGDLVEEGTSKKSMEEAFRLFGSLESRYGIFYIYGNHDRQLYTASPAYTQTELAETIESNGITILDDKWISIGEDLVLAGRQDASYPSGRISLATLLQDTDRQRFILAVDHQPVETEENAALGVDLELCGHTHAGQIFPVGYINMLMGTLNYGEYDVDGSKIIVSSGVTGWGFPVRTQGRCEYVVVHLKSCFTE